MSGSGVMRPLSEGEEGRMASCKYWGQPLAVPPSAWFAGEQHSTSPCLSPHPGESRPLLPPSRYGAVGAEAQNKLQRSSLCGIIGAPGLVIENYLFMTR